ncbi:hypothetical protein E1A91_D10G238300v1 [Gossypium mustelinum]|uniref:DUF455 domain-containing protein n=1 Tax=Gossypium mustelinum TaxID=34275 RepID=A0A5D2TBD2_GOSMU|nr:hypothetical protein E1A91_D10G238300v1 [Gossypium mustelinum]
MNNKTKFKYQKVNFTHFILNLSLNTVFHNCERARDESRSNRERKRDARRGGASCSKHSHPFEKARLGDSVASKWLQGTITRPYNPSQDLPVPDRPARLTNVKLVSPSLMPKLGKAGSLQSRQAIVHSLVHTESWAIDLSWDIIARFVKKEAMPREFFTDFVKVAQDEGRHFSLLAARLKELGSSYGALPAHDGLWDSAIATSKDLLARLAIEHCVHEFMNSMKRPACRLPSYTPNRWCELLLQKYSVLNSLSILVMGLDVLPTTISRFRNRGDDDTADLLERVVYPEEITHCAAGVKWFKYLCLRSRNPSLYQDILALEESEAGRSETQMDKESEEVIQKFHAIVRTHFRGPLKPPFNESKESCWLRPSVV